MSIILAKLKNNPLQVMFVILKREVLVTLSLLLEHFLQYSCSGGEKGRKQSSILQIVKEFPAPLSAILNCKFRSVWGKRLE